MPSSNKHISRLVVGLALLDMLLGGIAGWLVFDQLRTNNSQQTNNAVCALSDSELCSFFTAMNDYDYNRYQTILRTSDNNGQADLQFNRVDGPDKQQNAALGALSYYEIITTSDAKYTRDPSDNSWWKQPYTTPPLQRQPLKQPSPATVAAQYKNLGQAPCGSYQCLRYHVGKDQANKLANTEIWFDTSQHLVRKMLTVEEYATTEIVFTYDNQLIEVPANTKPRDEFDTVLPSYGTSIMPSADVPSRAEMLAILEQYSE